MLVALFRQVVCTYPLDLVRATMATQGTHHTSMGHAVLSIARERGVGALYSGVTATCVGVAPYAGLKFGAYETLKGVLGSVFGLREADLKPWQRLGSGLVAGMVAQTFVCVLASLEAVRPALSCQLPVAPVPLQTPLTLYADDCKHRPPRAARLTPQRGTLSAQLRVRKACATAFIEASALIVSTTPPIQSRLDGSLSLCCSMDAFDADLKTMPNVAIYMSLYDIVKMFLRQRNLTN